MTLVESLCLVVGVSGMTAAILAVVLLVRAQAALALERIALATQLEAKDQAQERALDAARQERQSILAETSEKLATELARMAADRMAWAQERADLVARASSRSIDEYAQQKLIHDSSPSAPRPLGTPVQPVNETAPWLSDPRWQGYAVSNPDQDGIVWVTSDEEVIAKFPMADYSNHQK
jgi:hypothetical protein